MPMVPSLPQSQSWPNPLDPFNPGTLQGLPYIAGRWAVSLVQSEMGSVHPRSQENTENVGDHQAMRLIISSIGMPDHLGNSRQRPFLSPEACVEATMPFQTCSHMRRYRLAIKISAFRSRRNVTFGMILLLISLQLVVLPLAKKTLRPLTYLRWGHCAAY